MDDVYILNITEEALFVILSILHQPYLSFRLFDIASTVSCYLFLDDLSSVHLLRASFVFQYLLCYTHVGFFCCLLFLPFIGVVCNWTFKFSLF